MPACVLIVEDQILIAWQLQELLEEAGYRVLAVASNPAEAIAAAGQERPDFALMDIRLDSGTSGIDAARELYDRWKVRSIYVSANLDPRTRAEAAPYRPLGFIGKPFLPADVLAAVRAATRILECE